MRPLVAAPFEPLSRAQRCGVVLLFAVAVCFGGIVEMRSVFLKRRMTDLDVYLRAAWAVGTGDDLYAITDDNGWHYLYPPIVAVLFVPLADPPAGADRTGAVPFAASVAAWYALNLVWLALGTNVLANALERTSGDPRIRSLPVWCQRWWAFRVVPVLVCLIPIGATLSHGQVNIVVLALLCAMAAAILKGHSFKAGLWLSAAICVKIFPAFLVLYPLWRRDLRCLAGCALGLVLGMAVIPAVAFGPRRAVVLTQTWSRVVLRPVLDGGKSGVDQELLTIAKQGNQSIAAVVHNVLHAHLAPAERPTHPTAAARVVHWLVASLLTVVTLINGRRRAEATAVEAVFIGLMIVTMLLAAPFSGLHYFALSLPLVMALVALGFEDGGDLRVRRLGRWIAAAYPISTALPHLPGLEPLREFGLTAAATTALWLVGILTLRSVESVTADDDSVPAAVRRPPR